MAGLGEQGIELGLYLEMLKSSEQCAMKHESMKGE